MTKKSESTKVKRPSFWLYWLPAVLLRPFIAIFWRHRIDRSELKGLRSPVLALSNHCSTIDIVLTVHTLLPKRYNIVTGRDLFTWKALKPFIKAFGCIPKNQCTIDIGAMRTMKNAVEQGRNIILYPEGRTSIDGKNLAYLSPAIAKFIRFMDCDVVTVHTVGAYLTRPRYCKSFKKGKIISKATVLFKREEIKSMTNEEIFDRVQKALSFNDHVFQRENNIRFKSASPAENLNYILYKCPRCGEEYEMSVEDGRYLVCGHCGNRVEYTEYGELIPSEGSVAFDRVDLWYDFERRSVTEELKKEDFCICKEAELLIEDREKAEFSRHGEGKLFIKDGYIGYEGTRDGEALTFVQDLKRTNTLVTKNSEGVDLIYDETIYRFLFKEHKWSSKYNLIVEQNFALKNGLLD